ncbi:MAG: TolC family protein [Planctomycetaceae bacterium]
MRKFCRCSIIVLLSLTVSSGCGSSNPFVRKEKPDEHRTLLSDVVTESAPQQPVDQSAETIDDSSKIQTVAFEADSQPQDSASTSATATPAAAIESAPSVNQESSTTDETAKVPPAPVAFDSVVDSVYRSYPLLQSALLTRNVAFGQTLGASGAFDMKVKGASENGVMGFYENYRQALGIVQPTYWGGEVFAGYRVGNGDFQPWYLERQTNEGGEFKAGVELPLARNRDIDDRRADLWKAGLNRQLAEPDIQAQLIDYVQQSSYAYWDWVAAGEYHHIAQRILHLAEDRTSRIETQVKAGFVDPPELTDNLRLVSIRQAKLADTRRKLQQTASKLSIYLRDERGEPIVPTEAQLPGFPEPSPIDDSKMPTDIQLALTQRPEIRMLDLMRKQVQIDYSNAANYLQPELNAVVWGSQDVGEPTSKKQDKSPFETEASIFLDVPVQRRKAKGKMTETQAKIAQLSAKRRLTEDKISVDVQMAYAALKSAWEQVAETQDALDKAEDLAARERKNQEAGTSDLLKVALREQYAAESAEKHVDALKLYFESQADYRAAMAQDQINR